MKLNTIPILLFGILLLQSCHAYYGTSVSLSEAHNQGQVKVTNTRGVSYEFLNIELRDSVYYGLSEKYHTRLESALITSIYLQDDEKSNTQSFFLRSGVVLGLLVLIILGVASTFSMSL